MPPRPPQISSTATPTVLRAQSPGGRLMAFGLVALAAAGTVLKGGLATGDVKKASGVIIAMLVADLWAVRLPGAGISTFSFGLALVLALDPGLGLPWAAVGICAAQVASCLIRPSHTQASVALLAALSEGVPQLLGCLAMVYVPNPNLRPFIGCTVYLSATLYTSGQLAAVLPSVLGERLVSIQLDLSKIRACACVLGVLSSGLWLSGGPAYFALSIPLFILVRQSFQTIIDLDEQTERRDVLRELQQSNKLLDASSKQQSELQRNLSEKSQEIRLLELSANVFLNPGTPLETAQKIIQLCGQLTPCSSGAVFVHDGNSLIPVAFSSPHAERLSGSTLSGLREPIVEMAWRSGQVQQTTSDAAGQRIFSGESVAMAFPWPGLGVLYLGRPSNPFRQEEHRFLQQAASLGGLGLRIALQLEELQRGLHYQQSLSAQLNSRTNSLDQLLQHSLQFMGTLDRDELQEILKTALRGLFPQSVCFVNLSGQPNSPVEETVHTSKQPMMIDDLAATDLALSKGRTPFPVGAKSLIAIPIVHRSLEQVGIVWLTSETAAAFGPHERDLLMILCNMAAVAWKNAELHQATKAAQAQLMQSSKMAAVGQLADGIAHELNTPLGSIALNLDFAKQKLPEGNPQVLARLQKASDMLSRTQSIVEKLLYYSRESKSGRRPTQLRQLVQDTIDLIGHALARDQVQVRHSIEPSLYCEVNQNEIQQVIFNLLLNARDAVTGLDVSRRSIVVEGGTVGENVFVKVIDQGCGIDPADQARVFDPFFTTKPVGSGTGLGLSVSLQIVQAHNGHLSFQSQFGRGSIFTLELPQLQGDFA